MLHRLIILCFLFTFTAAVDDPNHISINCGGAAALSGGRRWSGDAAPKGKASTASTVSVKGKVIAAVDPVPYETARISRSQFSYSFQLDPGQKFIRLHFNPGSYHGGFQAFNDFFTVEAGPFTLLANFSASITASALSLDVIVKEFCIITQENEPLNIVFSPEITRSDYNYAFINGIEIISVPSTLPYCHGGDSGVQVLGQKSLIYVENTTALERVYYHNIKWDSLSFGSDIGGMFGIWASKLQENVTNLRWRVPVDVGFSYLVRIHLGSKMDFKLLINGMIALTGAHDHELIQQGGNGNQAILWYNCMVMVEGHKREGKRSISISLHSQHRHAAPIEGFEVFKLSNHFRSLASPNPRPRGDSSSSSHTVQTLLYTLLGRGNAIATVVFAVICLVNIIVHLLHKIKMWGAGNDTDMAITEEENEPSARLKRVCRCFSLAEIQSATENFNSASILGKGGFGKVYRGFIDNGREIVAIKRSKLDSKQGGLQFWTEVETLSELRHVNLVSLIGYCTEQREMIIVYEYMPYGSLADHLYRLARKSNKFYPLSWKQRLKICIGASRALDYLHTHGIIHRDVKASNILLDEKLVAKFSDFGLAKTGTGSESQSQDSTNVKGTIGYIDPNYFRTRKLTKKSDIYSFGVVLLEVLCGRPAVEPWNEEDKRSLTLWAIDNISKGQVDLIVAPSLRGEISTDSLNTFVKVAERCLHDEPKKRPAMTHIIIKLELALLQQEKAESFAPEDMTSVEDVLSSILKSQQENMNFLVPNQIRNATDVMPCTENDRTIFSVNLRPMTSSFNVKTDTSLLRQQSNSTMINLGRKDGRESMLRRISQKLWPRDAFWKTRKPSNKTSWLGISVSALLSRMTGNITLGGNTISNKRTDGMSSAPYLRISGKFCKAGDDASGSPGPAGQMLPQPNLRVFTLLELKAATRNFRHDSVIGEEGFGKVYKGWLDTKSSASGSGTQVAVKKLHSESTQGFQEWQSEMNILGRLSHPNLVKLLGYGYEDKELLLVYELMPKGSLENYLFGRGTFVHPLPWDTRLKILIGAAKGLAFLHALDRKVIYRDFKASNILLDGSYHAKISDFGLAKWGPTESCSHVTTQVMGTYGYAAPEYVATGRLYVKSDVYGFGVVLVEMLTGMRALDSNRPSGQHNLVEWIKPHLSERRRLKHLMDVRLEGRNPKSVLQFAQLALNCLEQEPKNRPSMQEIVETLERIGSSNDRPRKRKVHFSRQAAK